MILMFKKELSKISCIYLIERLSTQNCGSFHTTGLIKNLLEYLNWEVPFNFNFHILSPTILLFSRKIQQF